MGRHSYSAGEKNGAGAKASDSRISYESTRPVQSHSSDADIDTYVATRSKHRLRRALLIVGAVLLLLVGAVGVWAYFFVNSVNNTLAHADPKAVQALTAIGQSPNGKPAPVAASPKAFNMLLLGTDNRGAAGDSRSDTILLARIDPSKKRVWILSLPRDTRADIPGYGVAKLNKAYTLGGAALTIDTVEKMLNVPINHYMEVNISGFKRIVDVLGGVWINVDTTIDDPKAAAANPGHEGQHINPGYQKLSPAQALVFVRSRDFIDADFTRMKHQQQFFKAVAKQSMTIGNFFKIPRLVRETTRFTQTDMNVGQLVTIARSLHGVNDKNLDTATLSGEWRTPFVYTDETLKADLLARMMSGRSFEETTIVGISAPADVSVTVRNGSGMSGVATKVGHSLETQGFNVREIGNARRSDYTKTLVVYGDSQADGRSVANQMGRGVLTHNGGKYQFATDVLVIVGRDWNTAATPAIQVTQ